MLVVSYEKSTFISAGLIWPPAEIKHQITAHFFSSNCSIKSFVSPAELEAEERKKHRCMVAF